MLTDLDGYNYRTPNLSSSWGGEVSMKT